MTKFRTSDGAFIVAQHYGPAVLNSQDPPLILMHGLSQQRHFWLPIIHRLPHLPIITLDLRGHGDADVPLDSDFSVERCAADVHEYVGSLGIKNAAVVGHSWGASVALNLAASFPQDVGAAALIDGAIVSLADLGPRHDVRVALTPPKLRLPSQHALVEMLKHGSLETWWNADIEAALTPTFTENADGTWGTRLGFDRHMQVLDAFFEYRPAQDWQRLKSPTWLICCDAEQPWASARSETLSKLRTPADVNIQIWGGAKHDVPLQWPGLVAGLLDTVWTEALRGAKS